MTPPSFIANLPILWYDKYRKSGYYALIHNIMRNGFRILVDFPYICVLFMEERKGSYMANIMALNAVYNHYLTSYSRNSATKYDTHDKNELRNVYHSIVKLNKEAPLYLLDSSRESHAFAIGVKEGARELHNVIASLGGLNEDELLNKKAAFSSDENIVGAQYIGDTGNDAEIPSYEIEVRSLASPQVNLGSYLPADSMDLPADTYSFDINIHNTNYEFQYKIAEGDTNKKLQEKLARLISGAGIGIDAVVETDGDLSALKLTSSATGAPIGKESLFTISDTYSSKASGSVAYLGIGQATRPASNAELIVNGTQRSVPSNHFTLEKTYEITINGISPVEGQTATVSVKDDTESLGENINKLVSGYNSFLDFAVQNKGRRTKNADLLKEMRSIASIYKDGLNHMGLQIRQDGTLTLNADTYTHSMEDGEAKHTVSMMRDFADSLFRKTNQISLDPMQYINNTMVAYKNPAKTHFATPYHTSPYSGMMFNSYC